MMGKLQRWDIVSAKVNMNGVGLAQVKRESGDWIWADEAESVITELDAALATQRAVIQSKEDCIAEVEAELAKMKGLVKNSEEKFFHCAIMLDDKSRPSHRDEMWAGLIMGMESIAVDEIIDELHRDFDETDIAGHAGANLIVVKITNCQHQSGQMTFPETGQWDFPPHWEYDIELIEVDGDELRAMVKEDGDG